MTGIAIPEGYVAAGNAPGDRSGRYEVLLAPSETARVFEVRTAHYDGGRIPGARWRTTGGAALENDGTAVFAWRPEREALAVVRTIAEPGTRAGYREALRVANRWTETMDFEEARRTTRATVGVLSEIFGIHRDEVARDVALLSPHGRGIAEAMQDA